MQIERESFPVGPRKSKTRYQACIDDGVENQTIRVISNQNGIIVGYFHLKCATGSEMLLCAFATACEYRRKGVGRSGMSWIKRYSVKRKARRITLHVRASNVEAIDFYRSSDFVETCRRPGGYRAGDGEERTKVTMELRRDG
jgi:ribosomal protein S18 acetylase RimI-like enzyme